MLFMHMLSVQRTFLLPMACSALSKKKEPLLDVVNWMGSACVMQTDS
jgi:hypothetical protein